MKKKSFFIVLSLTLALTILPYVYATTTARSGSVFGGFLLNPVDGNSYLAKMREGWDGAWKFTLPYTANPGEGGYLFLFYIFLGHLSNWINIPLIWTFHIARVAASVFLAITIYVFCQKTFAESRVWAERSFLWIALGSGLGWLFFPAAVITTDLWVPEAYPFLSDYVNPHFPLGLALLLWVFIWSGQDDVRGRILIFIAGVGLAIVQPFAVAIGAAVLAVIMVWQWIAERRFQWQNLLVFLAGGGPLIAYQFWIITTDPVLAGWNAQNQTPSPAVWDLVISFSPAILAACLVFIRYRGWQPTYYQKIAVAWFVCCLVLILFPFSLQRRFLTGFYIPVVILAGAGIPLLISSVKGQRRAFTAVYILSIPTIVVVLALGVFGSVNRDQRFYLTGSEREAFTWMAQNVPKDSIVLASPETGNFIPAYTGERVLYGHPFETVNAAAQKAQVIRLLDGSSPAADTMALLRELNVKYVFYGPRERQIGSPAFIDHLKPVFQDTDVVIYAVD